jgi:hypothetical protein
VTANGRFSLNRHALILTTGKSHGVVQGINGKLEGKALPNHDTTKLLSNPLVGQPIDLDAGTGAVVSSFGSVGTKNKVLGVLDILSAQIWVLKITN